MVDAVSLPDPSQNPPPPSGFKYMPQADVTAAMTTWSIHLLGDSLDWPGPPPYWLIPNVVDGKVIRAMVQSHPPDFQNGAVHRGVSLFEPTVATPPASGIDVSRYQGNPDFNAVKASGRNFVFIKATEGTSVTDASFATSWKSAKAAGLLRGAYLFFHPSEDGAAQAAHFIATLGADLGELPPVIDFETTDNLAASNPVISANLAACAKALSAASGRRVLIYTSPGFWDAVPGLTAIAAGCDLWVAHWSVSTPSLPTGWKNWTFWQYSSSTVVPGVAGNDDASYFNGVTSELAAYAGQNVVPTPPPVVVPTAAAVKELQTALNDCGASPRLVVDGVLGPKTKAACGKVAAS